MPQLMPAMRAKVGFATIAQTDKLEVLPIVNRALVRGSESVASGRVSTSKVPHFASDASLQWTYNGVQGGY